MTDYREKINRFSIFKTKNFVKLISRKKSQNWYNGTQSRQNQIEIGFLREINFTEFKKKKIIFYRLGTTIYYSICKAWHSHMDKISFTKITQYKKFRVICFINFFFHSHSSLVWFFSMVFHFCWFFGYTHQLYSLIFLQIFSLDI